MDIYEAGGGIHFTVNHTRLASEDELYNLLKQRLMRMLHNGEITFLVLFSRKTEFSVIELTKLLLNI